MFSARIGTSWCAGYDNTVHNPTPPHHFEKLVLFLCVAWIPSWFALPQSNGNYCILIIIPPQPPRCYQISATWDPKTAANCPFPTRAEFPNRGSEYMASSTINWTPQRCWMSKVPQNYPSQTILNSLNITTFRGSWINGRIFKTFWYKSSVKSTQFALSRRTRKALLHSG